MSEVNPSVTGAWLEYHSPGDRQFLKIGDLTLESGEVLPDVVIAYQSWGELNTSGDNAILVNHALTGWADVDGWWPQMVGPGLTFDTDKYFVVCPNVIGGCQGSTGPSSLALDGKRWGSRFPVITIRDMVQAELAFTKKIGVKKYQLAVGPSLGGMRSLEWAIQYPELIEGMGIARRIAHLTYRTESEMDVRFGRELQGDETGRYAVESYLDHQAEKLAKRFDANTYIALTEAMNSHDVGRDRGGVAAALATLKVAVHVVCIDTDRLFPPRLQQEIVELTPHLATLHTISSPFGHDGFLIEVESVGQIIQNALIGQKISN